MAKVQVLKPISDDANETISFLEPYSATVKIRGSAAYLFHRYSIESVQEKANAAKNSKAKKTDDLESYTHRAKNGNLAIPASHLLGSIAVAAKRRQDPCSPRKSAMELYKAGVVALEPYADLGKVNWDYLDRCPVMVQRSRVLRVRPAIEPGWEAEFRLMVTTPEYISSEDLRAMIELAGRIAGVGDYRPTYGRFGIIGFKIL